MKSTVPTFGKRQGDSKSFWHHDIHEGWSSFSFSFFSEEMLSHELLITEISSAVFFPPIVTTTAGGGEFFCASGVTIGQK